MRHPLGLLVALVLSNAALAQQVEGDKELPAVATLFEDDADFFIENLSNPGVLKDASVVDRDVNSVYSGTCSLSVTPFQRFGLGLPGWRFKIAENPEPGEYRYLRFAWKRMLGDGIMLQLFASPKTWHRYYAGTISEHTKKFGAMTKVSDDVPRQWQLVTRDLFADFGPMTITGISFSALEGGGQANYDHIYLGRTIEDLDRVTATLKPKAAPQPEEPAPAPQAGNRGLFWAVLILLVLALLIVAIALLGRRRTQDQAARTPAGKRRPQA